MSEKTLVELQDSETLEDEVVDLTPQIAMPSAWIGGVIIMQSFSKKSVEVEERCDSFQQCLSKVVNEVSECVWIVVSDPIVFK